MLKKNKAIHVKLIANPGAGNTSDAAKNLKLVIMRLKILLEICMKKVWLIQLKLLDRVYKMQHQLQV